MATALEYLKAQNAALKHLQGVLLDGHLSIEQQRQQCNLAALADHVRMATNMAC